MPRLSRRTFWPLLAGLAGGLVVGLELSRTGDWFNLPSWLVYGAVLILAVGAIAWWSERGL